MTLACFCSWAGWFESYLVKNPEDRFSCDMAHISQSVFWVCTLVRLNPASSATEASLNLQTSDINTIGIIGADRTAWMCRLISNNFIIRTWHKQILSWFGSYISAEREVTGLILGRDIPKSLKIILAAPRLALRLMGWARTGHLSVRIMWLGVVSCQVSWAWYFSEAAQ